MPTLRTRPSRGELPDQGSSPKTSRQRQSAAGDAIEVRESIEAKGDADEDVEMEDADADGEVDADADAEGEEDADGEPDEDNAEEEDGDEPKDALGIIDSIQSYLTDYEEDGVEIAAGFQRIPNKRQLPDYFDVIKTPIAFSTIRGKIMKKQYAQFSEFVQDVAQICHNAQVYNRPSAPIFEAAEILRDTFKKKLSEYVKKGTITPAQAELPDLGEIPDVEDSPPPEEDVEEEEEDEDEDEDEDDDDSDEEGGRRRAGRKSHAKKDDGSEAPKKRGRPPRVFTPVEARIQALLKGLRKFKNEDGELRVIPFEKLPDKAVLPDYYEAIKTPIALDLIKRKHKRKKYQSVDHAMVDLELMFENAKAYNEEGSEVYEDAVELQKQARLLAEKEKSKTDDQFRDEDGKLPMPFIEYKGENWKVGDWVHLINPNDPRKPIIAQIYRTWQDGEGRKWINTCWYYRPEQTVHRFEKFFYENEVVKTGQYRDHRIEEVDDRCFVMFITRFPKGRPRGFPPDKAVYVCEARYNEEKHRFNKIKTWASCLPDEVRDKDYEMDLFPVPRRLKKVASPIKHLLREDAKETDELPKPTWANPNAPPMIGAVHRRPREENESPPPEPTPPPPPAVPRHMHHMPTEPRHSSAKDVSMGGPSPYHPGSSGAASTPNAAQYTPQFVPSARPIPQPSQQNPAHHMQAMPAQVSHHSPGQIPQSPHYPHQGYPQQQYTPQPLPHSRPSHLSGSQQMTPAGYDHHQTQQHRTSSMPTPSRPQPPMPTAPAYPHQGVGHNQYNLPQRSYEVFRILDPAVEAAVPAEVRAQFHQDDEGRLLFFAAASREPPAKEGLALAEQYAGLGHSVSYLAGIGKVREERARKRKERDEARAKEEEGELRKEREQRVENERRDKEMREEGRMLVEGLMDWVTEMDRGTEELDNELGDWTKRDVARLERV